MCNTTNHQEDMPSKNSGMQVRNNSDELQSGEPTPGSSTDARSSVPTEKEAVDLGLPSGTLWASHNIGATKPEEPGNHFAWAETIPKECYDDAHYQHFDEASGEYANLGECISGTEHDAAHMGWGEEWQMPTYEQIRELFDNCTFEWTTLNGIEGSKFTGSNGNSIFLPAADFLNGTKIQEKGCFYWSGSHGPCEKLPMKDHIAFSLSTDSNPDWKKFNFYCSRNCGQTIRPVTKNKSACPIHESPTLCLVFDIKGDLE